MEADHHRRPIFAAAGIVLVSVAVTITIYLVSQSPTPSFVANELLTLEVPLANTQGVLANLDGSVPRTGESSAWLGTGQNPENSYLGMVFRDIRLPKGAQVTKAELLLVSTREQTATLSLTGFLATNIAAFQDVTKLSELLTNSAKRFIVSDPAARWALNERIRLNITGGFGEVVAPEYLIVIQGTGAANNAKYFASNLSPTPPKLVFTYSLPESATTRPAASQTKSVVTSTVATSIAVGSKTSVTTVATTASTSRAATLSVTTPAAATVTTKSMTAEPKSSISQPAANQVNCTGDFNGRTGAGNAPVDSEDFDLLKNAYGSRVTTGNKLDIARGGKSNGVVNLVDLALFARNYGKPSCERY